MSRARSTTWLRAALVAAVLATVSTTTVVAAQATTSVTAAPCAWPQEVGAQAANVFFPDSAATYWVMPYEVHEDLRITVGGAFPDARYASFNVYSGDRGSFSANGVSSAIADFQIAADPGSVNPWQRPAGAGGAFTVTLRADVAPTQTNTLPLAPADTPDGAQGYLVYRVYLPSGDIPLPTLTFTRGQVSKTLTPCTAAQRTSAGPSDDLTQDGTDPVPAADADLPFARDTDTNSLFPNADNAYLSAGVTPPGSNRVVLVRAKAPRAAGGAHPKPWPDTADDVRYWSLCTNLRYPVRPVVVNHLPDGTVDDGCRYDDVTRLDADGYATFVLGTEAQRSRIESVGGTTFVPFSLSQPSARHVVLLRNMLPVEGFTHAVQNVPQDGDPASAAAVMGDYYPTMTTCTLTTLTTRGIAGCVTD
jgi:hypothetical protein